METDGRMVAKMIINTYQDCATARFPTAYFRAHRTLVYCCAHCETSQIRVHRERQESCEMRTGDTNKWRTEVRHLLNNISWL